MENKTNITLKNVEAILCEKLGKENFDLYLSSRVVSYRYKEGVLTMLFITQFYYNFVKTHFYDVLVETWRNEYPEIEKINLVVGVDQEESVEKEKTETTKKVVSDVKESKLSIPLNPQWTFESFVVGDPNGLAYQAAKAVAAGTNLYNPLYFYSDSGLGKTHLMHSIAWYLKKERPEIRYALLSAERFMRLYVGASKSQKNYEFREKFQDIDVLLVDDIQFLMGKDKTQTEFFNIFEDLLSFGKQIILTADRPPNLLDKVEDRLKSRLSSGFVVNILPTTYELRLEILDKKSELLNIVIPQEVKNLLAEKITTSVRELEGALISLIARLQLIGGEITLEKTYDILKNQLGFSDKAVSMDSIVSCVAEFYKVNVSQILSKTREQPIARYRQIAMWLAHELTTKSSSAIAKFFDRDHSTVMHGIEAIEKLRKEKSEFCAETDKIRRMVKI
ncbi:MAG: chromosomal replication initiator protein DnaA [Alphaproteobacteria bacterium]|nr:chromosomal replication initiator protein DnaA [Alphaproteobacteria bacterium]